MNTNIFLLSAECKSDAECPYDKTCINENCINPCLNHECGRGAECSVQYHNPQCQCPLGTQGNPLISCIASICHYNEDCADHEACDRLNRICRPVCDDDSCADSAICVGKQHQPKCQCPIGTIGNPFFECSKKGIPENTECHTDIECPTQLACLNNHCTDLCALGNVCTPDQECRVEDTLPLRTIMCQCPSDTVVDVSGRCKPIESIQTQCKTDNECSMEEKCIKGNCIEVCHVHHCGVNALCKSFNHGGICYCAPGYTGNAHYECTNMPRTPTEITPPECYNDNDCTYDLACRNERCVNPCRIDKICAVNAFCSVKNHESICRCPSEYEGNPLKECIARK